MVKQRANLDQIKDTGSPFAAYTPVITATGGTAPTYTTKVGYYIQIGKLVMGYFNCINASGGTAGAGAVLLTISLPVAASSRAQSVIGSGYSYEAAGTLAGAGVLRQASSTSVFMQRADTFANILAQDQSSADRALNGFFMYEAA